MFFTLEMVIRGLKVLKETSLSDDVALRQVQRLLQNKAILVTQGKFSEGKLTCYLWAHSVQFSLHANPSITKDNTKIVPALVV